MEHSFRGVLVTLIGLLTSVGAGHLTAQDIPALEPATYTVYDTENGLPENCVLSVIGDQYGRIWVNSCNPEVTGTQGFHQFLGINPKEIRLTDTEGNADASYWLVNGLTKENALYGVNRTRRRCFEIHPDPGTYAIYEFNPTDTVAAIFTSGDSLLAITWSRDQYELYYLDDGEKTSLFKIQRTWDYSIPGKGSLPVICDDHTIWISDGLEGIIRIDLSRLESQSYEWESLLGTRLELQDGENRIPVIITDPDGNLIVYIDHLPAFYTFDKELESWSVHEKLEGLKSLLGVMTERWTNFYRDQRGNILVTTVNITPKELTGQNYSLSAALLCNDGRIYDYSAIAGLVNQGRFTNEIARSFYSEDFTREALISSVSGLIAAEISVDLGIEKLLPGRAVRGIGELNPDQFLVIEDGGDMLLTSGTEPARTFSFGPLMENRSISSFSKFVVEQSKLWLSTVDEHLMSYSPTKGTTELYDVGQRFDMFTFLDDHTVILANRRNQLYLFDINQQLTTPFQPDGKPVNLGETANGCILSSKGMLWFATENGLRSVAPQTGSMQQWNVSEGLPDPRVKCLIETSDGHIWAGLQSGGLAILDPASGQIVVRDKTHGLSNATVVGLLEDDEGNFWASTFNGITVFNNSGDVLFDISENEGLAHREFNRFSSLKSNDGRLLFGSVSGISVLDPKHIRDRYASRLTAHLYLNNIRHYDGNKNTQTDSRLIAAESSPIALPAAHRSITLEFGLSQYADVQNNNFFYAFARPEKTSADDDIQWTNIGNNTVLNLSDLPTGRYDILIRGIANNGLRAEETLRIPVRVKEFFYKQWWFYLACTVPLILLVFLWIRRLTTERQRLESEVAKRTQQIRKDKELIEQQAESLARLDEAKTRIYTNITHEFRTPLTVIRGTTDLLDQNDDKKAILRRNSDRLLNLVNQLLELSKLESGNMTLHMVNADMVSLVRDIFESFIPIAEDRDIGMHFYARPSELSMDLDIEVVYRICGNLLSNALKFTPPGGDIYLEILQSEPSDSGQKMTISVRDTGIGIPAEKVEHVFNRFYQIDDSTTRAGEGTGIGLSLTKELIEFIGGTITVHSTPGQGSEFIVRLPVTNQASDIADHNMTDMQGTLVGAHSSPPVTIDLQGDDNAGFPLALIVEDNPDVIHYIVSCLRGSYRIQMAMDGQEGFEQAVQIIPDIILSDVMMPVKDGIQLCDEIKHDEHTSHIPLILLTAKADIQSRLDGLERGADAYITKPFEKEELLLTMKNLIAARESIRKRYSAMTAPVSEEDPETRLEDLFVNRLNEIIDTHLDDEDFGVIELSRTMDYSRSQLHKKVKALTGLSPSGYLQRRRMQHARTLLMSPDHNISEVAYAVGFRDPSYFARVFRREFDISPTDFIDKGPKST